MGVGRSLLTGLVLIVQAASPAFAAPTADDYKNGVAPCMRVRAYDCAEKNWVQYLRLRPTDSKAVANLGIVFNLQGKHVEAVAQFQKAIAMGEGTYDLFAYHARSLEALGRVDEAIDWSYKALAIVPDLVDVRGDLAKLLVSKGRHYEALSLLSAYDEKLERMGRGPYFQGKRIAIESSASAHPGGASASAKSASFRASKLGDHFYVPVSVGSGRPRGFVLDTGAYTTMVSEEYLSSSKAQYAVHKASVPVTMADGRQKVARELVVAALKVGPIELRDVSVVACKGCALLLGQSTLSKFDLISSKVNGIEFMTLTPRFASMTAASKSSGAPKRADEAESTSPALARARDCLVLDEGLRADRQRLDAAFKASNEGFARVQQEGRELAQMRRALSDADEAAIDAYNQRVGAHNLALESANRRAEQVSDEQDQFNAAIHARNEKCSDISLSDRDHAILSKERQARRRAAPEPAASAP